MTLVESFQPDVFESLCDTASSLENQQKRIKKSVDRTLEYLDQSLEIKENSEVSKVNCRAIFYFGLKFNHFPKHIHRLLL